MTPPTPDKHRSFVDVTIDRQTMLKIRDRLRQHLVERYHHFRMVARLNRKVGKFDLAHQFEEHALCTKLMIWSLDNPMEALTPPPPEAGDGGVDAQAEP